MNEENSNCKSIIKTLKENKIELNAHEIDFLNNYKNISNTNTGNRNEENLIPVSFNNNLITFNLFQYKPYFKLVSSNNKFKCVYIMDEVGVGKTFETGILISELLYSGRIKITDNILIVCPNMLCLKWQEVLSNYFGLPSKIIKNIKQISGISIMSLNSVSTIDELTIGEVKLFIVDEAHNANGKRHENLMKLRGKSEYTVLISATPLSGKDGDLDRQKKLLFCDQGSNNDITFDQDGIYINKTLKDEIRDNSVNFNIQNHIYENDTLKNYIELCGKIFTGKNTLRKFVGLNMIASSTVTAKSYIEKLANLDDEELINYLCDANDDFDEYDFDDFDPTNTDTDAHEILNEIKNMIEKMQLYFKETVEDKKLEKLQEIIADNEIAYKVNRNNEGGFYKKIIIFTNYNKTAHYLNEEIPESIVINGEIGESEKWDRFNKFKTDENTNVLIITNVAAEGQDMDFCNTIVNYDLHYNPVVLAQRKGRIDRFEIKKNNLFIHNFAVNGVDPTNVEIQNYIDSSIGFNKENSIYSIILSKLKNIKDNTGIYYNVVDNVGQSAQNNNKTNAKKRLVLLYMEYFHSMPISIQNNNQHIIYLVYSYCNEILTLKTTAERLLKLDEIAANYNKSYLDTFIEQIEFTHSSSVLNCLNIVNMSLLEKNIYISEDTVNGNFIITTKINNFDFLQHVLDGGTIASHLIYNKGGQ